MYCFLTLITAYPQSIDAGITSIHQVGYKVRLIKSNLCQWGRSSLGIMGLHDKNVRLSRAHASQSKAIKAVQVEKPPVFSPAPLPGMGVED